MKAKKALKKLGKIEELLSDVTNGYGEAQDGFKEHIRTASESVAGAKQAIDSQLSAAAKTRSRVSAHGRKRAATAHKRAAAA